MADNNSVILNLTVDGKGYIQCFSIGRSAADNTYETIDFSRENSSFYKIQVSKRNFSNNTVTRKDAEVMETANALDLMKKAMKDYNFSSISILDSNGLNYYNKNDIDKGVKKTGHVIEKNIRLNNKHLQKEAYKSAEEEFQKLLKYTLNGDVEMEIDQEIGHLKSQGVKAGSSRNINV